MNKGLPGFGKHLVRVGLFVAACLAWAVFILYNGGALPTPGKKYTVTAIVPTSVLLVPGSRVTVAGAGVGKVKSIERADPIGPNAKIKLEITDQRVTPFPDDSRVQIRTRSQVGENYVSVDIGRAAGTVPDGGELGLDNAEPIVNTDQILSLLNGRTRARTRTLLQEFGGALAGRGTEFNQTIRGFNDVAQHGGDLVAALHRSREQTALIVDHLGRLMSAVGDRGAAIDALAARGLVAARAVADRDDELAATLRELPSTLVSVRKASATIGAVSDGSAPVVENLATAVRELEPAVKDFTPAAADGLKLVRLIDPARGPLGRTLKAVARVGDTAPAAFPGLEKTLCQLNPMLRYINPYAKDVLTVVYGLGSTSNSYDATGHLIRLIPLVNETSLSGASPAVLDAEETLLQSGAFLPQKTLQYNAYMKPGQVGREHAAKNGKPSNAAEQKAAGFKYTRVTADC
jgi:phospholipid/cholesterol/gamma-HCH transport system substrate-binding protein